MVNSSLVPFQRQLKLTLLLLEKLNSYKESEFYLNLFKKLEQPKDLNLFILELKRSYKNHHYTYVYKLFMELISYLYVEGTSFRLGLTCGKRHISVQLMGLELQNDEACLFTYCIRVYEKDRCITTDYIGLSELRDEVKKHLTIVSNNHHAVIQLIMDLEKVTIQTIDICLVKLQNRFYPLLRTLH